MAIVGTFDLLTDYRVTASGATQDIPVVVGELKVGKASLTQGATTHALQFHLDNLTEDVDLSASVKITANEDDSVDVEITMTVTSVGDPAHLDQLGFDVTGLAVSHDDWPTAPGVHVDYYLEGATLPSPFVFKATVQVPNQA